MLAVKVALSDMFESITKWRLWTALGWLQIRQRYKRSIIGPFWLTISMGVMVAALGVIYGSLMNVPTDEYLPMLGCGLVFWNFINLSIQEGGKAYIVSTRYIKQMPNPFFLYIMEVFWRQIVMLMHNAVVVVAVVVIFVDDIGLDMLYFIPGFILLSLNLIWIMLLLAIVSVRFRDLPQVVASIMQVAFYLTPVLFHRELVGEYAWVVTANPFAHMIDIVREPLLSKPVPIFSMLVCSVMFVLGTTVTLVAFGKTRDRIAYWA